MGDRGERRRRRQRAEAAKLTSAAGAFDAGDSSHPGPSKPGRVNRIRRWLVAHSWWMSPLALLFNAILGGGWWWQYRAESRAERSEERTLGEAVASKADQLGPLTAAYIRLRDSADVSHDWSARAAAMGMRSQILILRDDRNRMERQLAALEGRPQRAFRDMTLPTPIGMDMRLIQNGRDAENIIMGGRESVQIEAQIDSGDPHP
jgi:hypothetical protein